MFFDWSGRARAPTFRVFEISVAPCSILRSSTSGVIRMCLSGDSVGRSLAGRLVSRVEQRLLNLNEFVFKPRGDVRASLSSVQDTTQSAGQYFYVVRFLNKRRVPGSDAS